MIYLIYRYKEPSKSYFTYGIERVASAAGENAQMNLHIMPSYDSTKDVAYHNSFEEAQDKEILAKTIHRQNHSVDELQIQKEHINTQRKPK